MFARLVRFAAIFGAVLAIVFGTMAVAVAGFTSAKAPSTTTVSIRSQATLDPSGQGLNVRVTYSCFPGGYGKGGYGYGANFGSVRVVDLSGHQGFGNWAPTCNDKKQTAAVFVPGTFNSGGAAADAVVCGFDCAFTAREIKIS